LTEEEEEVGENCIMRNLISCKFRKVNNENDQVNKYEIGTACRMHEAKKNAYEIMKKSQKERGHYE
jgi:hypothetical protein